MTQIISALSPVLLATHSHTASHETGMIPLDDKYSTFPPGTSLSPPPSLCSLPSRDGTSSILSTHSDTTLLPHPITTPPPGSNPSTFLSFTWMATIFTFVFRSIIWDLTYAIGGTLWSCICGYVGWSVLVTYTPYSSASREGVLGTSALGGLIFGAAMGMMILFTFIQRPSVDDEERTDAENRVAQSNVGAGNREMQSSTAVQNLEAQSNADAGDSGFINGRWFCILMSIGIFGQCVGVTILHGRQAGALDVVYALRASALGELAVMPFLVIALTCQRLCGC